MSTTKDPIERVLDKSAAKLTAEERDNYRKALKKIVDEQAYPAEAFNIDPAALELLYGHAYRLFNSGQYQNALPLFAYLVTMNYSVPKYLFAIAACQHRLQRYEEALEGYLEAFTLDGSNLIPLFHASDCAIKLKADYTAFILLNITIELAGEQEKFSVIKERSIMMQQALKAKMEREEKNKNEVKSG